MVLANRVTTLVRKGFSLSDAISVYLVERGVRPAALVYDEGAEAALREYKHPNTRKIFVRWESDSPTVPVITTASVLAPRVLVKESPWNDLQDHAKIAKLLGYTNALNEFGALRCTDTVQSIQYYAEVEPGKRVYIVGWYVSSLSPKHSAFAFRAQTALGCPVNLVVQWSKYC